MRNALLSLSLVCLCACNPELGKVVWLVGDSISTRMLEELHFAAAAKDHGDLVVPVASMPCAALGRDLDYFTGRMDAARERFAPDVVVVSLGTNDLGEGEDSPIYAFATVDAPEELAAVLDAFMRALPVGTRVVWLVPSSPLSLPERVAYFREGLVAAQGRWPGLVLLEQPRAWFEGRGEDGVHHSTEGEAMAARAVMGVVDGLEKAGVAQ